MRTKTLKKLAVLAVYAARIWLTTAAIGFFVVFPYLLGGWPALLIMTGGGILIGITIASANVLTKHYYDNHDW